MALKSAFKLHRVSIVITAESFDSPMLSRDLLVATGIVPANWELGEDGEHVGPTGISVDFRNGVEWSMSPTKLSIGRDCKGPFEKDYLIHDLAEAYIRTFPYVRYGSLGLNWNTSTSCREPERWLTQRFLRVGPWMRDGPEIICMKPRFSLDAGEAVCNLDFSPGRRELDDGKHEDLLTADCNVHYPAKLDVEQRIAAIAQWQDRQDFILAALKQFAEKQHT